MHIFVVSLKILFSPTSPQYSVYTKEDWSEYLEEKDCIKLFSAQAKLPVN